ncbi:MAG: hypothetical protein JSU66_13105 [Deltaproteobacteria bacterium]|nr:MAG: hypothetical protein JSU66_13105 [Deltaproteobacteria bacterium]
MIRPDPLYEVLVSHYAELCAVSQYRPRNQRVGGIPGHAVMYLKGACRDASAPYPRLRPCRRASSDRADPEHGAGISVNRWFKNVNWVATPGKSLFLEGEVGTYELLDEARFERVLERALDLGMFRGVLLHPKPGMESPAPMRSFVRKDSLGTDFALRFGRTVFCARLPMEPDMIRRAMDFLNDLNDEYYQGEADYQWSGYADNCVHTLHNALAAAGVWEPKSVRVTKLRQLFNLAVPANAFVDLAFLSNEYPIEDFDKIHRDELRWKGLVEHGWLPATPGALVLTLPVLQVNALYDTKFRMFVLEGFLGSETTKRAQHLLSDGRYLQLDANLRYFFDRYEAILAKRGESGGFLARRWRNDAREAAREAYYAHIEAAQERVLEVRARLAELDAERQRGRR